MWSYYYNNSTRIKVLSLCYYLCKIVYLLNRFNYSISKMISKLLSLICSTTTMVALTSGYNRIYKQPHFLNFFNYSYKYHYTIASCLFTRQLKFHLCKREKYVKKSAYRSADDTRGIAVSVFILQCFSGLTASTDYFSDSRYS